MFSRPRRSAFTLIELLVVIAIIAILIGLLLPAVQKVRDAAARMSCSNNLKQLGLAAHTYQDVNQGMPGYGIPTMTNKLNWTYQLLPFIEQDNMYKLGPSCLYTGRPIKTYACPSTSWAMTPYVQGGVAYTLTSYLGIAGDRFSDFATFGGDTGVMNVRPPDSQVSLPRIADGTSNTLMFGERPPMPLGGAYGWAYYREYHSHIYARVMGDNDNPPYNSSTCAPPFYFQDGNINNNCDANHMWSLHSGGANFALCDGSVKFIQYAAGTTVIPPMSTRARGEIFNAP
jgi:prepilin-type N-terminal cleavage/methylation domain-containing protein/prepilin-type processing-associated H-X9-DG protein